VTLSGLFAAAAIAADWPQWRYDASRGASTPHALPADLRLHWVRKIESPKPAWPPTQHKVRFDSVPQPIVAGKMLFLASSARDRVTAYDTETGAEKWRFYAGGPVRFAPVALGDRLYFVSDDGYLYCVNTVDGKLLWRFLGGPSDRRIVGNGRLVGTWPARGGPAAQDGIVYFAAGIWPFMGIFIHALDAKTGRPVWTNSGSGSNYTVQPHFSPAFAGVAPQGHLAASTNTLLVSGGNTVPAAFDRKTGRFKYFHPGSRKFGKNPGGHAVFACNKWFINGGAAYRMTDGLGLCRLQVHVISGNALIGLEPARKAVTAWDMQPEITTQTARKTSRPPGKAPSYTFPAKWRYPARFIKTKHDISRKAGAPPDSATAWQEATASWRGHGSFAGFVGRAGVWEITRVHLQAGNRVYVSGHNAIAAIETPKPDGMPRLAWMTSAAGQPSTMIAADSRLFAVTTDNRLCCYGPGRRAVKAHTLKKAEPPSPAPGPLESELDTALQLAASRDGYCLVLGLPDDRLIFHAVAKSRFHLVVIDPDTAKVASFRRRMDNAGLYGTRVTAITAHPYHVELAPYFADLVFAAHPVDARFQLRRTHPGTVLNSLRPYGGVAYLRAKPGKETDLVRWARATGVEQYEVQQEGTGVLVTRPSALPGAAAWTHQYADPANTATSRDGLVKPPLGLLWFGGPSNEGVLPRHGHGPAPQVAGGRLFIEGENMLRAVDVYTGRLLWQKDIPGIGRYYRLTSHHPGAGEIGSNHVALEDGVYVMSPNRCARLDPVSGRTMKVLQMPGASEKERPLWGSIRAWQDLLIATAVPTNPKPAGTHIYAVASKKLVIMNRHTGRMLWSREAVHNFRHNAVAVGADKVFCIDGLSPARLTAFRRRGRVAKHQPCLYALDARTGEVQWKATNNVFATFLSYSAKEDVVVQSGSAARDRAFDEIRKGMSVHRARDGGVVWHNPRIEYSGPCLLHGDTIITQGFALDLMTGKRRTRRHPLTGTSIPWTFTKNYGCDTAIASRYLLTFRSAAAGFFDLLRGGTGNLGGFRSGCTANLIPADGVLSAPDYTRTCICSYQNQSSLAMIHMPEADLWTFNGLPRTGRPVKRVGINFGAPGDRMAENGTLWLDYPSVGGPSPDVPVLVAPAGARSFRRHQSTTTSSRPNALPWVSASGLIGAGAMTIKISPVDAVVSNAPPGAAGALLDGEEPAPFTVRLHFAEPDNIGVGERIFTVGLQGKKILRNFDIRREAGAFRRAIVREFRGVKIRDTLTLDMVAAKGDVVICGVELIAEQPSAVARSSKAAHPEVGR